MNCKPGDLAVIVRSFAGNEGRIVRCVRLISKECICVLPDGSQSLQAIWEIDTDLTGCNGGTGPYCQDSLLRPIRDPGDDAVDETLLWNRIPEVDFA